MLRLETENGGRVLFANVFIEEGERAVCAILYENAKPIALIRIKRTDEVADKCVDWMSEFDLTANSGDALLGAVIDEMMELEQLRAVGPDIANDWPGSRASRRLPTDM